MMKWRWATTNQVPCHCASRALAASPTPLATPKTRKKREARP
jgi:hypothetical protein